MSSFDYDDYCFTPGHTRKKGVQKRLKHAYRNYEVCVEAFRRYPTKMTWGLIRLWVADLQKAAPQFEPPEDVLAVAILHRYI